MACQTIFAEKMSLHLDGLLDPEEARDLLAHIGACAECTAIWGPLNEAHAMLVASAREPLEVPQGFSLKVMQRVAVMPVTRPQIALQAQPAGFAPAALSVMPKGMAAAGDREGLPVYAPDYAREWQHRVGVYVRGVAAVGAALAATAAVLVSLVMSGALPVSATVAPAVQTVRTFLAAGATWVGSLVGGVGADIALGGTIVLGLLALAGWQLVSNYHHMAADFQMDNPVLEAA